MNRSFERTPWQSYCLNLVAIMTATLFFSHGNRYATTSVLLPTDLSPVEGMVFLEGDHEFRICKNGIRVDLQCLGTKRNLLLSRAVLLELEYHSYGANQSRTSLRTDTRNFFRKVFVSLKDAGWNVSKHDPR